jgi:hypothetical protein
MNKKIFAAVAATIAALGSAVIAVPAQAVEQMVDVTVNVEPFIYLRTFQAVNLKVTQQDLGAKSGDQIDPLTDGKTSINQDAPTFQFASSRSVEKDINELYAVWGNTASSVTVKVTPQIDTLTGPGANKAKITVVSTLGQNSVVPTQDEPFVGGVKLGISFPRSPVAGDYTGGQLKVETTQP